MGLSSFNRARERQMAQEKVNELEEQLADLKNEFDAFMNDPEAMKARIVELESNADDNQEQDKPFDYSSLKVDEIKAVLTEKGISFDGVTRKGDLLALIPQEPKE